MERNVVIGGKEHRLVANGATPRIYRGMFKKDLFTGMANATNEKGEIKDMEIFENLAYCMAVQGGSVSAGTTIEDWLGGMDSPMAIIEATAEIMTIWNDETDTTSEGKKE